MYIYTSNESDNIDVFFDNLEVVHHRGPILEETHYYPFGLTMAGISSKASNFGEPKTKYKYQQYELNETFDINLYESFYRSHDPQLGRFWQVDPRPTDFESPYAAMGNNPLRNVDFLGDSISGHTKASAERMEKIVQGSYTIEKLQKLFKIGKDGLSFDRISKKAFSAAIKGVKDKEQINLAKAYKKMINDNKSREVSVLKREEKLDEIEKKHNYGATTGEDVDSRFGGGRSSPYDFDPMSKKSFVTVIEDSKAVISDNIDIKTGSPVFNICGAGEILFHELGHTTAFPIAGLLQSIQATNLYHRAKGHTYYRTGKGHFLDAEQRKKAQEIPDYFKTE